MDLNSNKRINPDVPSHSGFFVNKLGVTVQTWGRRKEYCFMTISTKNHEGKHLVYCTYIKRNGKIIYPKKSKVFKFWVKD